MGAQSKSGKNKSAKARRIDRNGVRAGTQLKGPKGWSVLFLKDEKTKAHSIEIKFQTRTGESDSPRIGAEDRSETAKIVKQLASRNADLPSAKAEQITFVQELVASTPTEAVILTTKPGFRGGDGFVMPNENYGTARGGYVWADEIERDQPYLGQSASTVDGYNRTVAKAAPITVRELRDHAGPCWPAPDLHVGTSAEEDHSETALFNIAGDTTTGKTCVAMATAGVMGNSNALIDWDTTMRGVDEASESRNDLVLVLDDTGKFREDEAALRRMVHALVQKIPAGRSRTIAKKAPSTLFALLEPR